MPSHKIHLAIAKKVNETINMDLDSIMLGSVLPDLPNNKDHSISHFQNKEFGVSGTANPDLFIKKYKDKLDNPIMIGYLIHLLTDKFFNIYMFSNFYIYDDNKNTIGIKYKHKDKYMSDEEVKEIKQREFYIFDKYLLNHNKISKFLSNECINKVIDIEEAIFDKEKLNKYIIDSNKDIDNLNIINKLFIYSLKLTTIKELNNQFNLCCQYIMNYLKNKIK